MSQRLWTPSDDTIDQSAMTKLREFCAVRNAIAIPDHDAFHQWSIDERGAFWSAVWDFCGVRGTKGARELVDGDVMLDARFFPDAELNFAENLLVKHGPGDALVYRGEDKVSYRWSWDQLHSTVSKLQQAFRAMGIGKGDRISAMMPNMPETIACMLATASIGAIWSSCLCRLMQQRNTTRQWR
ncbi:AMP-binding protein [Rhizobium leguminosarum bv. viciae]|uniref:AMP-binding protein n=1 Tax=Rhizobium leguminosarum bv. viciae TaxID=387 RepID=A0A8I2GXJ4_RHILV|nr:AMP-binding protein [Rhizobium leguminosarum]NKK29990.1 AMP-binding protein [Rhizobium leguminosarum bv. viciae]MBY5427162.1 AMP-binding protein [Rhizobium leguminosarum]MBY5793933.1 AMP-binding protein [Rhizobium leguminosarum]MBY5839190.1 AMP-binding protein [Rhizobium leguminosarum]